MRVPSLVRIPRGGTLPFGLFDVELGDAEARRAPRKESIYHVGQARIWDGREVLAQLVAKHGAPSLRADKRRALARAFAIIMWGELAAWKISLFEALCEAFFPSESAGVLVPAATRLAHALQVVALVRPSVAEQWGARREAKHTAHAA